MTAIPDKTILNGSSNPTTSQFKNSMGQLWDYLNERNDVNAAASGLKVSANKKLLGRNTSGAGTIEEITYTDQGYAMLTGATQLGARNKIINGDMRVSQRGTSFDAIASGTYSLDRWITSHSTTASVTVSQQTNSLSSTGFGSNLQIQVTTADTSITTTDNFGVFQNIEGYNISDLVGKTFAMSFWVRSSVTGTHCVNFRNIGLDRTYVSEYTVNSVNTWEYKTIYVVGGLPTAGTWNLTNGLGLSVGFSLACGPTYQTTAGSWQTGNFLATSSQVNCLGTIGNIFAITGVQLEAGSIATPFEHRPYGTELALCQRYYYRSFAVLAGIAFGGSEAVNHRSFPVQMRATPTMTTTPSVGTGGQFVAGDANAFYQAGVHSTATTATITAAIEL